MLKYILLLGLLGGMYSTSLKAQETSPKIQVNLDDLGLEELSTSERLLIHTLVKKEVKKLEKEIEQLNADRRFGRITEAEYKRQKRLVSERITDKIGRSIDILTAPELNYTPSEIPLDSTRDTTYIGSTDSTEFGAKKSRTLHIRYKTMEERRGLNINLSKSEPLDTTQARTYISGNFGLGFTNWMDDNNERYDDPTSKLSGNSSLYYEIGFKANYYLDERRIKTSVDFGITLISRYYHFNNKQFAINYANNGVSTLNDNVQYTKSVFSQTALEFPLTFTHRFTNGSKERLAVSAGVYGGINIRSRQKMWYSVNNRDYKSKWISDFNTNQFYAGTKMSIGYNGIYLIARYNFSALFKSSSNIDVYPYTIGISYGL